MQTEFQLQYKQTGEKFLSVLQWGMGAGVMGYWGKRDKEMKQDSKRSPQYKFKQGICLKEQGRQPVKRTCFHTYKDLLL